MTRNLFIAVVSASVLVGACSAIDDTSGTTGSEPTGTTITLEPDSTATPEAPNQSTVENLPHHAEASDYVWDGSSAAVIVLDDRGTTTDSSDVEVSGSTITITGGGTYLVSGALSDGELLVAADNQTVRLVLDGVDVTNTDGPALSIVDADEVILLVADGSANRLSDGPAYVFADTEEDEPNATVFSTADLTIAGTGTLTVDAAYNDGIGAKDGLVIAGTTVTVTAVDDGIRGKDYLVIDAADVTVTAGGDGLKSDNDSDPARGYIQLSEGTVTVTAGGDAISATTDVLVDSGTLSLTTGGGSDTVPGESSVKGIKGLVSVVIDGGRITVDSADDAVHSDGTVTVNNGDLRLSTGDDGIHADSMLTIGGGTTVIDRSYEGLESAIVSIDGGFVEIHSDDDGINVAGGSDGSGFGGPPGRGGGRDQFEVNSDYKLLIAGGSIVIYAQGDGLDSNGIVEMSGGTVLVHGPTANFNGALDAGSFDITGGTLVAVGSAGMAEGVDSSSSQPALEAIFGSTQEAGTTIHIESIGGTPVLTFQPVKSYASIVFSSAALEEGATYDIFVGGAPSGENTGGLYQPSAHSGGDLAGSLAAG